MRNIRKLLCKAGLEKGRIRPLDEGKFNDSYLVEPGKDRFVLRIAPPDQTPMLFYEQQMMRAEPALHRWVRKLTGVPVPEVVYQDFSRKEIDRDFLILSFCEGCCGPFDHAELGGYVRQLHSIEGDRFGYPCRNISQGDSWPELFRDYVGRIFEDCRSCGIIDEQEESWFLSIYDRCQGVFKEIKPSLLHLDLWSENILVKDGKISALLDFDRGMFGDPELEFAVLDTYRYSTRAFFNGYGSPRPEDGKARIRRRLYLVYEVIKYAFIRFARNGNHSAGRSHVEYCRDVLRRL